MRKSGAFQGKEGETNIGGGGKQVKQYEWLEKPQEITLLTLYLKKNPIDNGIQL